MVSVVILMIEQQQPDGLSARKLVVESAHPNVLTSSSGDAGLQLLGQFPHVEAVLAHSKILSHRPQLIDEIKAMSPHIPVILARPFGKLHSPSTDFTVDSHRPHELLNILQERFTPLR